MELTVKLLQSGYIDGNSIKISISPDSSILSLKQLLASSLSLQPSDIRILMLKDYNEILLSDEESLSTHGIIESSKLMLDVLNSVSFGESDAFSKLKPKEVPESVPNRDWLGQVIEKIKSGSLTGMLQIIGEYEREKGPSSMDEDENLFSMSTSTGWTPMHFACFYGHSNIVQLLVARQANPNRENDEDLTPLMIACKEGHVECVRSLLKHPRIQVNKMTHGESPALHKACRKGLATVVQLLVENKACMILEDQNGWIPLQYATSPEIFDLIPRYMGDLELQKARGEYNKVRAEVMEGELCYTGSLVIHDEILFAYLDPDQGTFTCFKSEEDYKKRARGLFALNLYEIWDVKYSSGIGIINKDAQCFTVISKEGNFKFYSDDKEYVEDWISSIVAGIEFCQVNKIGVRTGASTLDTKLEIDESLVSERLDNEQLINFKSFTLLEEIGSGSFGKVYKVIKNDTKQVYALKQLNKEFLIKQKQLKYAIGECKILTYLDHPFIIKMNFAFQTPKNLYMVLDYCPNGDLMTHLSEKGRFPESVARFYIAEIILAIEYLHSLDIVYRDLKPENILLDRAGHIRLADFGLAKENVNPINKAMSFCGSPAYLAPELLSKTGSEKSADVYGIGAILYEMLSGLPPFYSDNIKELFKNIKRAMLQFPKIVRNDAQDLIRQLMSKDPNKRPKLTVAKQHVFFKEINWEELEMKMVKPPRLGPKWLQMDNFSEEISNYAANKNINDEDYLAEDSMDKVADFNFSRCSVSYLGK